jgi:bacteriocin-like protein
MEKLSDEQLNSVNGGISELAATSLKALGKIFMNLI